MGVRRMFRDIVGLGCICVATLIVVQLFLWFAPISESGGLGHGVLMHHHFLCEWLSISEISLWDFGRHIMCVSGLALGFYL